MKRVVHKFMLWAHRWLGIVIGIHFVLLGLTGSYLVYTEEIDALMKPDLKVASAAPVVPDLERIVQSARQGLGVDSNPTRMTIASEDSRYNHRIMFNIPKGEQKRRFVTAYVDAATFEFKGSEVFKETLGGFFFVFHHDLFSGGTGRTIVAVTGVLSMILLLGGLYLWWPGQGKSWKRSLRYNKQRSFLGFNLELHKFLGFYSLILMCIVTFSGIYLARPDWFFPRGPGEGGGPGGGGPATSSVLSFSVVQPVLSSLLEEDQIAQFRIDMKDNKLMGLARDPEHGISGWEWDLATGELLNTKLVKDRDFRKKFGDLQRAWHVGDFWGELGRFLVFVSGILPLVFYFTGTYYWWKKKKKA